MKTLKRVLCIIMVVLTIGILCACKSESSKKTTEDYVRDAVADRARSAYLGSSIGGNELKRSQITIATVRKVSETEYLVSGKIVMTDVYGTNWNNTFDCKVTGSDERWLAGSFEYTSKNWSKE